MKLNHHYQKGLARTRDQLFGRISSIFRRGQLDDHFYDELEEVLIAGDVGVSTSLKLIEELKQEILKHKITERAEARTLLADIITAMMTVPTAAPAVKPLVILLVGVNGSGKTTSAAKLAGLYRSAGKKTLLVAGDTYRAAAVEQLEIWSQRVGSELIKQQAGSDPAALYFDALNAARARQVDVVIGDTAGRLHSKFNLMEELNKIYRVIGRNLEGAPHQVFLVVDATTGHNAIAQAEKFNDTLPLDGIILTKLDGTARGGIVVGIQDILNIPVCYIGTGEEVADLVPFDAALFVRTLLGD